MLKIKLSTQIKKDLKLAKKRHCNFQTFEYVVNTLAQEKLLETKYRDHSLSGKYSGYRECHVENDWLLIYKIYKDELILYLYRSGSHSDLFKK